MTRPRDGRATPDRDPARAPILAERLLGLALRSDHERDMVLGDLQEQFPRRGSGWYWRQAIAIAAHAIIRRSPRQDGPARSGDFFMFTMMTDVRRACRSLVKRPLLTGSVAVTLAMGLGANAAIFNFVDRLILRPFTFANPDNIVMLSETGAGLDYRKGAVAEANFLDWRDQADAIGHFSALTSWDANLLAANDPERIAGVLVSSGFFDALGLRPSLGRGFVRDDETWGRHRVAVISDALWKRRFAGDPAIVGRRITIDGEPYQVIGIAPPRFAFPEGSDIWAPLALNPATPPRRDRRYLTVVGQLAPGATLEAAQTQMSVLAARLARDYPEANRDHGVSVLTLTHGMRDPGLGPMVSLWQASAVIVLLIACANIANLLMARASERRRETAVRLALGARRGRVVRELFIESLVLALTAVPPAVAFAWVSLRLIRTSLPANIVRFVPGIEALGVDMRLFGFTLTLAVLTACIFGILPALQAARSPVADALKEGGRSSTSRQLLRRAIVVAQMSIALPLLVAAGMGVLGAHRFLNGPQGYDPDGLLVMKLALPERTYPDQATRRRFAARALDALRGVAGVESAAVANTIPAGNSNSRRTVEVDGKPAADPRHLPEVANRLVSPDYFQALGIPLTRGRSFTAADREDAAPVAIVSESMAKKLWADEDAIGRRVRIKDGTWLTIVGISGDVIHDWFDSRNEATLFRPFAQSPVAEFNIAVRTAGDPASLAASARRALLAVDPAQPVFDLRTQRVALRERTVGLQYLAGIMSVFAVMALVLSVVGLYAVISYLVAQRQHEIGLRIALGASAADVIRMTVGQALRLTVIGAGIGLLLSVALNRLMQAGLLGIASGDARLFAAFAAVLVGAALLAGYLPARRAASIDPMTALRAE
ncbi:MAG: ABC transporter permease [Vicinamibacterales bacterium]